MNLTTSMIFQFLKKHRCLPLTQYETEHLTSPINISEIKFVVQKKHPKTKRTPEIKYPGPDTFIGEIYQKFKELMPLYTVSGNSRRRTFQLMMLVIP